MQRPFVGYELGISKFITESAFALCKGRLQVSIYKPVRLQRAFVPPISVQFPNCIPQSTDGTPVTVTTIKTLIRVSQNNDPQSQHFP
jgi:hypothetical protein